MITLKGKAINYTGGNEQRKVAVYKYPDGSFLIKFERSYRGGCGLSTHTEELRITAEAFDSLIELRNMILQEENLSKTQTYSDPIKKKSKNQRRSNSEKRNT